VVRFLGGRQPHLFTAPGWVRMVPAAANGQPAFAAYLRGGDGVYRAHAVIVLSSTHAGIARIVIFLDPGLFGLFGLPPEHGGDVAGPAPQDRAARPWPR
jgi:RNA polymerase sigma-70 factor (ECF subfamily)